VHHAIYGHAIKAPGRGIPQWADLPMPFGTFRLDYCRSKVGAGEPEVQPVGSAHECLLSFVSTGDAGLSSGEDWPHFAEGTDTAISIGHKEGNALTVGPVPKLAQLDVWDALLGYQDHLRHVLQTGYSMWASSLVRGATSFDRGEPSCCAGEQLLRGKCGVARTDDRECVVASHQSPSKQVGVSRAVAECIEIHAPSGVARKGQALHAFGDWKKAQLTTEARARRCVHCVMLGCHDVSP